MCYSHFLMSVDYGYGTSSLGSEFTMTVLNHDSDQKYVVCSQLLMSHRYFISNYEVCVSIPKYSSRSLNLWSCYTNL